MSSQGAAPQAEFSREPLFPFLVSSFFLGPGKHEFQLEEWDYSAHLFAFSFLGNKAVIAVSLCLHYEPNPQILSSSISFKDPQFAEDFVFKATVLPGAK